jgi:UDP-GlcNAc:undecaprenyl-phosphate GlcNAc-1-phosphate transferase
MSRTHALYLLCGGAALLVSLILTPLMRQVAIRLNIMDHPDQNLKTHENDIPYLGGIAILAGFIGALVLIRFFTHFPTGTLKSIRGIFFGTYLLALIGLVDDTKRGGLHFKTKFVLQMLAALVLIHFDVRIKFANPPWVSDVLTIFWVIGITNALNLCDIMDGLAGGITVIASLAFLFISLPTEEIYVNFASAALAGACLGFLPFNLSKKRRIFMGDTGSLSLGFVLAALAMGTSYTKINNIGLFSPLLILVLPIYDTVLVTFCRLKKGQSPFLGSKDHFPLRLKKMGLGLKQILLVCYTLCVAGSIGAYLMTTLPLPKAVSVMILALVLLGLISWRILKVEVP